MTEKIYNERLRAITREIHDDLCPYLKRDAHGKITDDTYCAAQGGVCSAFSENGMNWLSRVLLLGAEAGKAGIIPARACDPAPDGDHCRTHGDACDRGNR